jgi:GNAT superfamily N-acetyltransferase
MITIKEIHSKKEIKDFIIFAWQVYKDDPNWVPPLIMDTMNMLDKKKSPFFEFGEAAYLVAYRDGKPVGRVTAHVNNIHNEFHKVKEGFFGFYECLNDDEAAVALLKAAEDWVRAKGMTKIIGPESFCVYDETCFLADGWDADPATPVVLTTYTPKYYLDQMAKAGFQKEIDWYAFKVTDDFEIKDVFLKMKARLEKRRGLKFRSINLKRLDLEIPKIKHIFRDAWSENWGHFPMSDKQFDNIAEAMKIVADERVCFMVEDGDKPVATSITLPDINPSVKKMNGRFLPFGIFHFLAAKKKAVGCRTFMMGVEPEYRNLGIDAALVAETFRNGRKAGYKFSECSLIVETNINMIEPMEKFGGKIYKTYRLFSKQL